MAETFTCPPPPAVDPATGFCAETAAFHSLRPAVPLPDESLPLSFPSYALSLLPSPLPATPAFVDSATGLSLSYPAFLSRVRFLSLSLRSRFGVAKGDVAFVLSPASIDVPVLYFALLSIGAVVSPSNPLSSPSDLRRHLLLSSPSLLFATSSSAPSLPANIPTILLDSPEFRSLQSQPHSPDDHPVVVRQTDTAAIQFSSGTTGRVKAAAVPHRSLIAMAAGFRALRTRERGEVTLLAAPLFHTFGFFFALKGIALGETVVLLTESGFGRILGAAERYGATALVAAPPVVVAMARSAEAMGFDLGALETVTCGGAPLSVEAAERFIGRFPRVELRQQYGATEAGVISSMINRHECRHVRSAGRLTENMQAKIVDVATGKPLPVGQRGELWVRGPTTMTGYVGDDEANASTFDSEGWLRTGDLCYFDGDGFLYVVDRLKELIKYKAYQVPPAELEHLLHSLPEIADAAVVPYPQEEVGQIPVAFVVRRPGSSLSEGQVMDYVANQVAPYKKIRKVVFVESIPKSATGKVLRRELASRAICDVNPVSRL